MKKLDYISSKIFDRDKLRRQLNVWKFFKKRIVFTNGCFDILHSGHVKYLADAADLGDVLIIGLNSDASVRQLKGSERPVVNEESRALLLASLEVVDAIVIFEEETPYELIKKIEPDVLVKGGDWKKEEIVGHDIVSAKGGEVKSLQFVEGHSTTSLIEKIKQTGAG